MVENFAFLPTTLSVAVRSKDASVFTRVVSRAAKEATQPTSVARTEVPDSLPLRQFHFRIQLMAVDLRLMDEILHHLGALNYCQFLGL